MQYLFKCIMVTAMMFCISLVSACGFQPLYKQQDSTYATNPSVASLENIRILPIQDRIGQKLHNALRNQMNRTGQPSKPLYSLQVVISQTERRIAIREDKTATRANLILKATYYLIEQKSGKIVLNNTAQSISSFNILEEGYTNYVSREDAMDRGIHELSIQIRDRLAGYLNKVSQTQ